MYPPSEWRLESYVIIFPAFFSQPFKVLVFVVFLVVACWVIVTSQESQVWHIATRAARPKAAKGQCQQNVFRTDPLTNAEQHLCNTNQSFSFMRRKAFRSFSQFSSFSAFEPLIESYKQITFSVVTEYSSIIYINEKIVQ